MRRPEKDRRSLGFFVAALLSVFCSPALVHACDPGLYGPTCTFLSDEQTLLYDYLLGIWNGAVTAPSTDYCDETINSSSGGMQVDTTCDGSFHFLTLSFSKGSYSLPSTFGPMFELTSLKFNDVGMSLIDDNMPTLPMNLETLSITELKVPSNGIGTLTGEWGLVASSLQSLTISVYSIGSYKTTVSKGTLGPDFGSKLSALTSLTINGLLQGTIPGNLLNKPLLLDINLSSNVFSGISTPTSKITGPLTSLKLNSNRLAMSIDDVLNTVPTTGAITLDLSSNFLTGTIDGLIPYTSVKTLNLGTNQLTGTIPTNLMTGGTSLSLLPSANNFTCPIINYSGFATSTDFSASYATSCGTCSGTCQNSGICTANTVYPCYCPTGWYGKKCAFPHIEQLILYNKFPTQFSDSSSLCTQTNNECHANNTLKALYIPVITDGGFRFHFMDSLESLTYGSANFLLLTITIPQTVTKLDVNGVTGFNTGSNYISNNQMYLPNLKTYILRNAPAGYQSGVLNALTSLEEYVVIYDPLPVTRFNQISRAVVYMHPTIKKLTISSIEFNNFILLGHQSNTVLEELHFVNCRFDPDIQAYMNFQFFSANMPAFPNLKVLEMPYLLEGCQPGMFDFTFDRIFASQVLDLRGNNIGGEVPIELSTKPLDTLLLADNNFAYPIYPYEEFAVTTDYDQVSADLDASCEFSSCVSPEVCTITSPGCTDINTFTFYCLNGGTIVGTYPDYTCSCTVSWFGYNCGMSNQLTVDVFDWQKTKGGGIIMPIGSVCSQGVSCTSGNIVNAIFTDLFGDLFTTSDFTTTSMILFRCSSCYLTNLNTFVTQNFAALKTLDFNTISTPDGTVPDVWSGVSAALGSGTTSITFRKTFNPYSPNINGMEITPKLTCDIQQTFLTSTFNVVNFDIEDCSHLTVEKLITLNINQITGDAITTDRIMRSLMRGTRINTFSWTFMGTGTPIFERIANSITTSSSGLANYPPAKGPINATSFETSPAYAVTNINGITPYCPVIDFDAFTSGSTSYSSYTNEIGSGCEFCRPLNCSEGYVCDPATPACVPLPVFCDYPQCANGGTCSYYTDSCLCPPEYSGYYCERPNTCDCENFGTCFLNGTCACTFLYTGDKCQTPLNPCECENGGTCLLDLTCACLPGYEGDKCQVNNTCGCLNGGFCEEGSNACDCPMGFEGNICQINNTCGCENGGFCQEGTSLCNCTVGYEGDKCQINNTCGCLNGGQCFPNSELCNCTTGYEGTHCQVNNTCGCLNGGQCFPNSDLCNCTTGYEGTHCQINNTCGCENGGQCFPNSELCNCTTGYEGDKCQINNTCGCLNGGQCFPNSELCNCTTGYEGDKCQVNNTCGCENGGFCQEGSDACDCPTGYEGNKCQINNTCGCLNGGQCFPDSELCNCTTGYEGDKCQVNNTCGCLNGGQCFPDSELCNCTTGYEGDKCQVNNTCGCLNGGQCFPDSDLCNCTTGYEGDKCQVNNTCGCLNGGSCAEGTDLCNCTIGYEGNKCQINNTCGCLNGGQCFPDSELCNCTIGYEGDKCQVNNTCGCLNNGTCLLNGTCECMTGYEGTHCQINNTCGCENGGSCFPESDICNCTVGFEGDKCQINNTCGCQNNGTCLLNGTCVCVGQHFGDKCQYNDTCECQNGGTCLSNGTCACPMGYYGEKCQFQIDCHCQNNGTCLLNGTCVCQEGYFGNKCQNRTDCGGCQNGGTCLLNGTCVCPPGYHGEKCEFSGPCDCFNGGTCLTSGICVCISPYTGNKCQYHSILSHSSMAILMSSALIASILVFFLGALYGKVVVAPKHPID